MRIVIVGGGIAAVYLANNIKKLNKEVDVLILSDEEYIPYDRIHLCSLVDKSSKLKEVSLYLEATVKIELNQKVTKIETKQKRVVTSNGVFSYDKLIIATGSIPKSLFDISNISNAAVFRSVKDCQKISEGVKNREVVLVGSGPISLELLETLNYMEEVKKIYLIVRSKDLYSKDLSFDSIEIIKSRYLKSGKVKISFEDEIIDKEINEDKITKIKTKKLEIDNPFLIFGVGISPNIDFARDTLECSRGIVTNTKMQTSNRDIYAVGEAAEVRDFDFIAGHVKDCTSEADTAIANILGKEVEFQRDVSIDMLKVGEFDLIDVSSPCFGGEFEKIVIASKKDNRIDEYFLKNDKLIRFIGINSNIDVGYIEGLIKSDDEVDATYLYQNRLLSERGRLICSCEHIYYKDIEELVASMGINSFLEFSAFSEAGRVCGRCKKMVEDVISNSQYLIDPNMPKKSLEDLKREKELQFAKKRVDKYNSLHPANRLDESNLEAAMKSFDIQNREFNRWISMITADMMLHPEFESVVKNGVKNLNKVPIIWLELADCSGNSEAFIKSTHPSIDDLIFDYISLDYHELIMRASGDDSENILESIIKNQKKEYILIVEGAVPLGLDGKYLRIGKQGETGINLLKKCAKDAALILSVGSCALDGGVVAAYPNPTNAVGVSEALGREDIINLPGCPVNPTNIIGTLLHYLMFEETPQLDKLNRPLWAYQGRIHDNCERRGHYDLGEYVKEWGDEGAKRGWCLFEMGCKGPYANANCPTMKFNQGVSWPIQAGHGCMACVEPNFFDKYANERKVDNKSCE